MTNNRSNPRVFCGVSGRLEAPWGPVRGKIRNLSRGGTFFQSGELLPVGKSFELAFELPDGSVRCIGEVRYHHRYVDGEGLQRIGAFIDANR
ncbi:MAG: PilZ domain-containing protein [Myxococcales bacterium]